MVGAEIEPGSLPCPAGDGVEKVRLEHPVFMMTFFRPRIRKQDPDFGKSNTKRQRVEKLEGVRSHKVTIAEFAALGFAVSPGNPLARQIYAHTEALGKFCGVALEKMPVTAADFPDNRAGLRQNSVQLGA